MERERLGRLGIFSGELAAFPADVQRRVAAELEALGYGAIWYGEAFAREAFVQGAIFLTATERMVVASGIANIYARDAVAMAFGGRSLNELGGGRFLLGLGVAHVSNVTARGHEYGRPVPTMRAYLEAMDRAEPLFDALVAGGGVDEIGQRVREHREAGADHVVLNLITRDPSRPYVEEARLLSRLV